MRRLATILAVLAALPAAALTVPVESASARSLSGATAQRHAERIAAARARHDPAIAGWSIARGFRFTSRKWVFAWWAQMADGRVCSAQLVTRYASLKSSRVVGYFRMETCS
jgi:hypothetical protein